MDHYVMINNIVSSNSNVSLANVRMLLLLLTCGFNYPAQPDSGGTATVIVSSRSRTGWVLST